ncbi:MAG: hypothetical protein ACYTG6_04415 [Planctomycetota bacterium]|jgi:hypothetical protein
MRVSLRTLAAAAPLALLLLLPLAASAEDELSPDDRYARATGALPAPGEAGGFTFDGDLVVNGALSGTCHFSAVPAAAPSDPDGPLHWKTTDRLTVGDGALRIEHVAYSTSALLPVEGRESDNSEGERAYAWKRESDAMKVVATGEGMADVARAAPHEDPSLTTLAAVFLFCRLAPMEPATYGTRSFDPSWDFLKAETPFREVVLEMRGEGTWEERPALLVQGTRGKATLDAAFDVETRDFLGARLFEEGRMDLRFVPKGSVAPPEGGDVLRSPATTPEAAAARAGYAFATADMEVLEDVIHWPTLHEALRDPTDEEQPTLDEFRAGVLASLEQNLQPNPRGMIEGIVKSILGSDGLEVERQGEDRAVVTFPAMFRNLQVKVGEIDGVWYLVELPRGPGR